MNDIINQIKEIIIKPFCEFINETHNINNIEYELIIADSIYEYVLQDDETYC